MTRHGWTLRAAAAAVLVIAFAVHRIDSVDVWLHLATGRWIAAHHALPATDPFGPQPGAAWVVHDWAAALGLYEIFSAGGAPALGLFAAVCIGMALLAPMARAARRGRPILPFECALLVSVLISYERYLVRPELVTLLAAVLLCLALAAGAGGTRRGLAALAILQATWANSHAGFVLGPVLAAAWGAGEVWAARRARGTALRQCGIVLGVLLLACCCTPRGPGFLLHAVQASRTWRPLLQAGVVEWQPTLATASLHDVTILAALAGVLFTGAALGVCRRSVRAPELAWVVTSAALALTARRNLVFFGLIALPVAAGWVARDAQRRGTEKRFGPLARRLVWIPALLSLALASSAVRGSFYAAAGPPRTFGTGWDLASVPVAATELLLQSAPPGPVFTNIAAGTYLLWRTDGTHSPWIDGRLLDAARFAAYRGALGSYAEFAALAEQVHFGAVLLALQPFAPLGLMRGLLAAPGWRLVALDGQSALFLPEGPNSLPELRLDTALPAAAAPTGEAASWRRACDPGGAARRGRILLALGAPAAARADLTRALLHCPEDWELSRDAGFAALDQGDARAAEPLLLRAARHDAQDRRIWSGLAACRDAAGDPAGARAYRERAGPAGGWH